MKNKIYLAQQQLQNMHADGWLIYDFHRNNELAHLFLEIPVNQKATRRFFYWIPARGEPVKIVHAIESHCLDAWPGERRVFLSWESLQKEVGRVLKGAKKVAMEYSPKNAIPYISKVDAGTVDLVRSFGVEVVSSGAFLQQFTAVITKEQGESHIRAGRALERIIQGAWDWIAQHLRVKKILTEWDVQQWIMHEFKKSKLITDGAPIVGVNEHSADPHYMPLQHSAKSICSGDFILIDLWCKEERADAVFADISRVGVAAKAPTQKQKEIFSLVRKAQKQATELVKSRFQQNQPVYGWEVDDAARSVIREGGYGEQFLHRTGHSIEVALHGSGAHMDNLEMHDERPLLRGTCCSIEPGIYLADEFGIRLEYDLYIHHDGMVEIVGGVEDELICLE